MQTKHNGGNGTNNVVGIQVQDFLVRCTVSSYIRGIKLCMSSMHNAGMTLDEARLKHVLFFFCFFLE